MPAFTVTQDLSSRRRWLVINDMGVVAGSATTKRAAQEIANRLTEGA